MWESSSTIRGRFRRQVTFLQWPYNAKDAEKDEGEEMARHPTCTKSLELNVEALDAMLDYYNGMFTDVYEVQAEARQACPLYMTS